VLAVGFLAVAAGRPLVAQEQHPPGAASEHAAASAPAAEPTSSEEATNPLQPQPALAFWTLVVFVGLVLLLGKFAWKPLLKALHERERHLEHVLHETERARNESEGLLSEHRKQMARAADEVRGILEKARQDAQAAADQLVKQAQGEAEAARQRAQRDIATARDQALAEIWQKTADMAVLVAGRVLAKELNDADHHRLLEAAIQELPAAPGVNGQRGQHA
jgi:F-type H+-transporting ATPase subunit b